MLNYCPLLCYCKYSIKLSVSKPKNFQVVHTHKQLGTICMSAQQVYLHLSNRAETNFEVLFKIKKGKEI